MAKTVKDVASDNNALRRRVSELTDRVLVLERSLQTTQERMQSDMTSVVKTLQEMRQAR